MIVHGIGPPSARIAFVGEAPGVQEVRSSRPFVGPAGQLLDKLLAQVSILRSRSYVTNVVKERPPNNDISIFLKFEKGNKVTASKAYYDYEDLLYRELRGVGANVIVALGAVALFALTRKIGIMNWRGSIIQSVEKLGYRKVIPTIHPSAALREFLFTHLIRHDLKRIKEQSAFPEIRRAERMFRIKPSFQEAMDYLTTNLPNIIGFDIENPVKHVVCFAVAKSPTDAMSIPLTTGQVSYFNPDQEAEILLATADLLTNPEILKVGHNIKHDAYVMFRDYGIVTHPLGDTCIASKLILPDFPKKLAFGTSLFTEIPYYKFMGGRSAGAAEVYDK